MRWKRSTDSQPDFGRWWMFQRLLACCLQLGKAAGPNFIYRRWWSFLGRKIVFYAANLLILRQDRRWMCWCWPKLDQTCIIYHVIISLSSRSRNQSVSGGSTPAKRYGCLGKFARNTWTWKGHLIRQCFIFWLNTSIKCTCVVSLIRF